MWTASFPGKEKRALLCGQRAFLAASAFAGWLCRDKLGEGNQRSERKRLRPRSREDRDPATAGELRSAGGCGIRIANFEWRLCRRLKPDFPLWRIRRQNVKGFAHVPGRTEEALLRWLSVNSSQSLGKSAESQTSGMVSDRGSPKMVVALSRATPCGWNFSAAR